MSEKIVRIGGASGGMIDSAIAVPQLLSVPGLNYLVLDYLGEGAMGMFARQQMVNPKLGFMPDIIDNHIAPYLREMKDKGVKFISNGGGLDPRGLADAIRQRAEALGVKVSVAAVDGDDLRPRIEELRKRGFKEMYSGAPFPKEFLSANAYFGGFPIAAALDRGADIVVTGRVVDSALSLGPLIHEFGWKPQDHDLLAAGTVVGHLLECGAQATGGTFTDWQDVPDWAHIGFPVGECRADGSCVITKAKGTGGLVSVGSVAEQLMYEVSDPQAYFVPDVVADFTTVKVTQQGPDRVLVAGATGYPPTATYKVSATYDDGWRCTALQPIIGIDAGKKAERQAAAILERTREMLRNRNMADWRATHTEILGHEAGYGDRARQQGSREVIMKLVVEHDDKQAIDLFWREQFSTMLTMSVGTTVHLVHNGTVPLTQHYSFLLDKKDAEASVTMDGQTWPVKVPTEGGFDAARIVRPAVSAAPNGAATKSVPLISLAWARSGEKGELFNVAVIARRPEYLPYIRQAMSAAEVAKWYRHFLADPDAPKVTRYEVPGIHALNFVVDESMCGGVTRSPRLDSGAKGMAQQLLEFPVPVPAAIATSLERG